MVNVSRKPPAFLRVALAAFAVFMLYGVGPVDEGTELELGAGAGQHYDQTADVYFPEGGCEGNVTPRARDLTAQAALRHRGHDAMNTLTARATAGIRQTAPFTVHVRDEAASREVRTERYGSGPLRPALAVEGAWGLQGWFGGFELGAGGVLAPREPPRNQPDGGVGLLAGGHINFGPHVYIFALASPSYAAWLLPQEFPFAQSGLGVRTARVRARLGGELGLLTLGLRAAVDVRFAEPSGVWFGPTLWVTTPTADAVSDRPQYSTLLRLTFELDGQPPAAEAAVYGDDEYPYETDDDE